MGVGGTPAAEPGAPAFFEGLRMRDDLRLSGARRLAAGDSSSSSSYSAARFFALGLLRGILLSSPGGGAMEEEDACSDAGVGGCDSLSLKPPPVAGVGADGVDG